MIRWHHGCGSRPTKFFREIDTKIRRNAEEKRESKKNCYLDPPAGVRFPDTSPGRLGLGIAQCGGLVVTQWAAADHALAPAA